MTETKISNLLQTLPDMAPENRRANLDAAPWLNNTLAEIRFCAKCVLEKFNVGYGTKCPVAVLDRVISAPKGTTITLAYKQPLRKYLMRMVADFNELPECEPRDMLLNCSHAQTNLPIIYDEIRQHNKRQHGQTEANLPTPGCDNDGTNPKGQ